MQHTPDPRAEFAAALAASGLPVLARAVGAGAVGGPGIGAVLEALAALTRDGYDDAELGTAEEFLTTIAAGTDQAEVARVVHEQCEQVLRPELDQNAADDGDDDAWASSDDAWLADVAPSGDGTLIRVLLPDDVSGSTDDATRPEHEDAGPLSPRLSRPGRGLAARSRPPGRPTPRRRPGRRAVGVVLRADPGRDRRAVDVDAGPRSGRNRRATSGRAPPGVPPPPPGGPGPLPAGRRVVARSTRPGPSARRTPTGRSTDRDGDAARATRAESLQPARPHLGPGAST